MANYFGFMDETGVLYGDPQQRFFALGLLKTEDVAAFSDELRILKNKIESTIDLDRQKRGLQKERVRFEFKFSKITKRYHTHYYELLDLYFKFKDMQMCCLVFDKDAPGMQINEVFGDDTWRPYISYAKMLIKNNVSAPDKICILADYLGKPKASNLYYEPEIKSLPVVYNACMLESHASLFIQVVDVLIGGVVYDFKRTRTPGQYKDVYKGKVTDFLKAKIGVDSLTTSFTKHKPNYFSVWEFKPKSK